jgi:hypothetical protein
MLYIKEAYIALLILAYLSSLAVAPLLLLGVVVAGGLLIWKRVRG